jgi:hypothetical protein
MLRYSAAKEPNRSLAAPSTRGVGAPGGGSVLGFGASHRLPILFIRSFLRTIWAKSHWLAVSCLSGWLPIRCLSDNGRRWIPEAF